MGVINKKRIGRNMYDYEVTLDIHEVYFLLESCFRGSHLRTPTIDRFTDMFYEELSENDRYRLFTWLHRDFGERDGGYVPRDRLCGSDEWFFARFDPNNQYEVTYRGMKGEKIVVRAFKKDNDGRYYVGLRLSVVPEVIVSVRKLNIKFEPHIA